MNDAQWCALVHMWLSSKNKGGRVNSFISYLVLCDLLVLQSNTIVVIGSLRAEQAKPCKSQVPPGYRILLLYCPPASICK
jgi:hypothetical protein